MDVPATGEPPPPWADRDLREVQWRKGGGEGAQAGHGGRHRHAALGAETNGGVWQESGAGDVQMDITLLWERSWVSGARERGYGIKRY